MKKLSFLVGLLGFAGFILLLGSCGTAGTGFYAPAGSTITLPDDPSPPIDTDLKLAYPFLVEDENSVPLNGVQVSATCVNCTFWDAATGPKLPNTSDISNYASVGTQYTFKTDAQGSYTLIVYLKAPQNMGTAIDSYVATVIANIGVATAKADISVSRLTPRVTP